MSIYAIFAIVGLASFVAVLIILTAVTIKNSAHLLTLEASASRLRVKSEVCDGLSAIVASIGGTLYFVVGALGPHVGFVLTAEGSVVTFVSLIACLVVSILLYVYGYRVRKQASSLYEDEMTARLEQAVSHFAQNCNEKK